MLRSPQSLPPAGSLAFSIESPPHALSASAAVVASAASTACVRFTLMLSNPSLVWTCSDGGSEDPPEPAGEEAAGLRGAAGALRAVRRDPVEHDPEQHDRDPGREPAPDVVGLAEALDDVEAEGARADHAPDHDHRQHVEEPLVRGEEQRAPGHRQ